MSSSDVVDFKSVVKESVMLLEFITPYRSDYPHAPMGILIALGIGVTPFHCVLRLCVAHASIRWCYVIETSLWTVSIK